MCTIPKGWGFVERRKEATKSIEKEARRGNRNWLTSSYSQYRFLEVFRRKPPAR